MREQEKDRQIRKLVFVAISLTLMISIAFSTSIKYTDVPKNSDKTVATPGQDFVRVAAFTIQDGGDTVIKGQLDAGDSLYSFQENNTMFLNQTDTAVTGINGFDNGEDVLNVSVIHNSGTTDILSGETIGNFSSEVHFTDGGNLSDGEFNGDGANSTVSEALILDNTSAGANDLDSRDYVVSEGRMNISNFSSNVQFIDVNSNGLYDPASEALVRNSSGSLKILDEGDRVLLSAGASLTSFSPDVKYADGGNNDGNFEEGNVILDSPTNTIFERTDSIRMNGSVDFKNASNVKLAYYNSTPGSFQNRDEAIYHEPVTQPDLAVNESDVRIGEVELTVSQGLRVLYNNSWYDSSPEIGKPLYNVTSENTGYSGDGTFRVYEYAQDGSTDGVWNPGDSGDQEVLFYDVDSQISGGDTLSEVYVYDSNTSRDTIPNTIEVGERFNSTQASNVNDSYNSYTPAVNITFDGSDSSYDPFSDNVTLNVSHNGNSRVVIVGPAPNASDLGYQGTLHDGGYMRFWNSSAGSNQDEEMDGIFIDMDKDGVATTGDVRLGGWKKINPAGQVSSGSADIGINLTEFNDSEDYVKIIDNDHNSAYTSGTGLKQSREAMVVSDNSVLESTDAIVRTGLMDLNSFENRNPERRFIDATGEGAFNGSEAIVKNDGSDPSLLEDSDTVIEPGNASLTNLSDETRFVENGLQQGFEVASSEAIVWDDNIDGVFETGYLNQSPDQVLRSGEANLMPMKQPPSTTGGTGLVYVDKNSTGRYNTGEDILQITLIENGSVSEKINGTEIYNFADSTKHNNSEGYKNTSAVVNDTDMNTVFEDVFEGLEIENRLDKASNSPGFLTNISGNEIDGGDLVLYRDGDGDAENDSADTKVSDIQIQGTGKPYTWSTTAFTQRITSDTSYLVMFNASTGLESDLAYGFKANITTLDSRGSEALESGVNSKLQVIDSHAPEITNVWTGNTSAGNSPASSRDRIYVETNERYQGINYGTVDPQDFSVNGPGSTPLPEYRPSQIISRSSNNFEIRLNDTFSTGREFSLQLDGTIRDLQSGNGRNSGNSPDYYSVMDGIRPRIVDVLYQDTDVNGAVDLLKVVFSENISEYSYEAGDWSVEDRNLTGLKVDSARNRTGNVLPLNASADAGITGVDSLSNEPRINYSNLGSQISDGDGNYLANVTGFRLTDDSGPLIWNGTTKDQDNDARPDKLVLNFTEQVYDNQSMLENSSFKVVDPSSGEVESVGSQVVNDSVINVNISNLGDTSVNPTLRMLNNTIFDAHGNAANASQDFSTFVENSNPVLVGASISQVNSTRNNTFVELQFSEPVLDSSTTSDVEIANQSFNFSTSNENSTRLVEYGEALDTSIAPRVTNISGIVDDSGNAAALFENGNVTVNTVRRRMHEGWNFVSLPIADGSEPEISSLMNTSKVNVVWTYYKGEWKTYDPDASINDFDSFDGGRGYLVNVSESFMFEANVANVRNRTKSTDLNELAVEVGNGWNLIGHFEEFRQAPSYDEAFATLNNVGAVVGQEDSGSLELDTGNLLRDDMNNTYRDLNPGDSYWMWKDSSGTSTYRIPFGG